MGKNRRLTEVFANKNRAEKTLENLRIDSGKPTHMAIITTAADAKPVQDRPGFPRIFPAKTTSFPHIETIFLGIQVLPDVGDRHTQS
jgi:hypothetical protein